MVDWTLKSIIYLSFQRVLKIALQVSISHIVFAANSKH